MRYFEELIKEYGKVEDYQLFLGWGIHNPIGPTMNLLLIETKYVKSDQFNILWLQIHPMTTEVVKVIQADLRETTFAKMFCKECLRFMEGGACPSLLLPSTIMPLGDIAEYYTCMMEYTPDSQRFHDMWMDNYVDSLGFIKAVTCVSTKDYPSRGKMESQEAVAYARDRIGFSSSELSLWCSCLDASLFPFGFFAPEWDSEDIKAFISTLMKVEKPDFFKEPLSSPIIIPFEPVQPKDYADLLRLQFNTKNLFGLRTMVWMAACKRKLGYLKGRSMTVFCEMDVEVEIIDYLFE